MTQDQKVIPIKGDIVRPPFPVLVDSTMIGTFRSCPKKFEYEFMRNLAGAGENTHLIAGAALAKGLETTRRMHYDYNQTIEDSIARGLHDLTTEYGDHEPIGPLGNKSWDRVAGALEYYFHVWPLGSDHIVPYKTATGHAIEYTFAIPLPINHPETGEEILYAGRFDMLCQERAGSNIYVEDDKTTSQLGGNWNKNWDLRSQFTGYCWASLEQGIPVVGAIIRGVALLKTQYSHAQTIVYRPAHMIHQWHNQVIRDLRRMIQCWEEGYFDYNLDNSCSSYGGCAFMTPCMSAHPENWLADYVKRDWNPIAVNPAKGLEPPTEMVST